MPMNKLKPGENKSPGTRFIRFRTLPAGIWTLGFVSMFMDISSELIHSLLPVFMSSVLGASMSTIGIIEGIGEATAAVTKIFSGAVSDYFGKRKLLAVIGYGLAAITKPVFPLATSIGWVFAGRFTDRVGKGIRGAPRDALVADIAPPDQRGAAFGLRQSLDSAGAFIGPLIAVIFMALLANNLRQVLWIAVFPAFMAVALLIFGVRDPHRVQKHGEVKNPLSLFSAKRLPFRFWLIVVLGSIFTLARFSEAFLILRARDAGLAIGYVPFIMIVMNLVYTVTAYPAGLASDRRNPRALLIPGLLILFLADLLLAAARSPWPVFIGAALWGLHMGLTQGLFAKLVADSAPIDLRGTAFGIFNLFAGGALFMASVVAGVLWSAFGAPVTFLTSAALVLLTTLGLLFYRNRSKPGRIPFVNQKGYP